MMCRNEREGSRDGSCFCPPRLRTKRKNERQFVQNDCRILDEHRVGKGRLRRKRNDVRAEFFEELLERMMLLPGLGKPNRRPGNKRQLAIHDAWADGPGERCEHGRKVYMNSSAVQTRARAIH